MAIKLSDYKKASYKAAGRTIEIPGLYVSKANDKQKGRKYLARFRIEDKIYSKVLGYSKKNGTTVLTPREAGKLLEAYKEEIMAGYTSTDAITLDYLFELYYSTLDTTKAWTQKKKRIYNLYIKPTLGKKRIKKIREMDIQAILSKMNERGLSPRTRKGVLEVLNPLFRFALKNKYLKENPATGITVKIPSQKRIVMEATNLLKRIFAGINELYHDAPFYRALYLFALSGRRKSEILNLKWENIEFERRIYWLETSKNGEAQSYKLPDYLIEPLQAIKDDRTGLVFKSPITGGRLSNIDRQTRRLKEYLGMKEFSIHYLRNVLVSALAEQGIPASILSGVLGHRDITTINKYLTLNYLQSSDKANESIGEIIDTETTN